MAVDVTEVVTLYQDGHGLTMQEIAERVGVSKARVHQILKDAGVETGHRYRPRAEASPRAEKAYRAYQMTPETQRLIELLAEALDTTRTAVVTRAVEELADRHLPGSKRAKAGSAGAAAGKGGDVEGEVGSQTEGRRRKSSQPGAGGSGSKPRKGRRQGER